MQVFLTLSNHIPICRHPDVSTSPLTLKIPHTRSPLAIIYRDKIDVLNHRLLLLMLAPSFAQTPWKHPRPLIPTATYISAQSTTFRNAGQRSPTLYPPGEKSLRRRVRQRHISHPVLLLPPHLPLLILVHHPNPLTPHAHRDEHPPGRSQLLR